MLLAGRFGCLILALAVSGCALRPAMKATLAGIAAVALVSASKSNDDEAPADHPTVQIPRSPDCLSNPKLCQ